MEDNRELFLKYMNDVRSCTANDGYPKILTFEQEQDITWKIKQSIEIIDNDKEYFQFRILNKSVFEKNVALIIKHNLLYVTREARIFFSYNMVNLMDLIQEGNIGLYQAAIRFEPSKGWRFITYARGWIRQAMFSFISEKSRTVTIPIYIINDLNKIKRLEQKLFAANGYVDPLIVQFGSSFTYRNELNEIVEVKLTDLDVKGTDLHPTEVMKLQKSAARGTSLSTPTSNAEDADTLEDTIIVESEEAIAEHRKEANDKITIALKRLAPRDKEVMEGLYGINKEYDMSVEDLAEKMNLTTTTINCIRRRCLIEMKASVDLYEENYENVDKISKRIRETA
jgi:RNA polymerase primary sigma factor